MANYEGSEGIGSYPVFNTQGTIALYGQILQKKQAQRAAEQKELTDKIGKLKTDGLRDYDKQDYYNSYNTWRELEQQANQERDQRKRFELKSKADQAYQGLNELVARSADKAKRDAKLGMEILRKPHLFNDEGKKMYQRSLIAPLSSKDNIEDYTTIPIGHDLSKVETDLINYDNKLLNTFGKQTNPIEKRINAGNRSGTEYQRSLVVKPEDQALHYASLYDTNDAFQAYVEQKYANLPWDENPKAAKAQAIQALVNERRLVKQLDPERIWDFKESDGDGSGSGGFSTPRDINVPYSEGKASVNVKNFIGLSVPAKNFAGSPAYNMKTGELISGLSSSNDYEVVGVGNFPFISKDVRDSKGRNLKGTLAQPDYESMAENGIIESKPMVHVQQRRNIGGTTVTTDLLVPYDRLPDNVRNSKPVREALAAFKPATQQSKPANTKSSLPKKGDTMKVKEGTAIFNGERWVLKK